MSAASAVLYYMGKMHTSGDIEWPSCCAAVDECSTCGHSGPAPAPDAMVPHPAYYGLVPGPYLHSPVHGQSPLYMQSGNPAALAQQVTHRRRFTRFLFG